MGFAHINRPSNTVLTRSLQIVLDGYQTGELKVAGEMQPNWYATFPLDALQGYLKVFHTMANRRGSALRSLTKKIP